MHNIKHNKLLNANFVYTALGYGEIKIALAAFNTFDVIILNSFVKTIYDKINS